MTQDESSEQDAPAQDEAPEEDAVAEAEPERSWEGELDAYPSRDPSEDPRWAVRMVWGWVGFTIFSIAFIVVMLILGAIYD